MPHSGQSRRQEKRCWLPTGEVIYVEEGTNCPGIGQRSEPMNRKLVSDYFGGRRRAYWAQEGGFAPPFSLSSGISQGGFRPIYALLLIPGIFVIAKMLKSADKAK